MDRHMPPGCDGRRLRFPCDVRDDESIPGVLIAALGPQWLDDARPVLSAAGIQVRNPGLLSLASEDVTRRLAWVLRCDPKALVERLSKFAADDPTTRGRVCFSGIDRPRGDLETSFRRIGPMGLAAGGHHRLAWLDRLLPYCPFSLELLVDTCGACGSPLRWTGLARLDLCGSCGATVPASNEPPLCSGQAYDYRGFAALCAPLPRLRAPAAERLPERLASLPAGTLVRLALRLGGALRPRPVNVCSPGSRTGVAPTELAAIGAEGHRLLTGWPDSFLGRLDEMSEQVRDDRERFLERRAALRRLVHRTEQSDIASLVLEAAPDLARHATHGFAGRRRYYIARQAARVLGLRTTELPRLRGWSGLDFAALPGAHRSLGQYGADQIDELAATLRGSSALESAAGTLGIPVYAAEQLARAGRLDHVDHPALFVLGHERRASDASVETLGIEVAGAICSHRAPASAITLERAMRIFGGGEKPWGAVVEALTRQEFPAWKVSDGSGLSSLLVDDETFLPAVNGLSVELPSAVATSCSGSVRAEHICQRDAAEILNLNYASLLSLVQAVGLRFFKAGRGLAVERSAIGRLACELVSFPELQRAGWGLASVRRAMIERGVPTVQGGWCRQAAVSAQMLPSGSCPADID